LNHLCSASLHDEQLVFRFCLGRGLTRAHAAQNPALERELRCLAHAPAHNHYSARLQALVPWQSPGCIHDLVALLAKESVVAMHIRGVLSILCKRRVSGSIWRVIICEIIYSDCETPVRCILLELHILRGLPTENFEPVCLPVIDADAGCTTFGLPGTGISGHLLASK